ncbi:MAG: response regulator transcription factor [Dehalococcoidia bacterium]|nr:response regulator transcription factor [Dehalococcoidia bacterium]
METPRILVVDDEPVVVEVVERYLQREGYAVHTAADGRAALEAYARTRPHLVVLDLMLPQINGMEVCRSIRENGRTPVIMLTARGDEMDRIAGFDIGADDYLAKPFSPRELVARVKAVLRRSFDGQYENAERIESGDVVLDPRARSVVAYGTDVDLTAREFDLLRFFVTHPMEVYSREQLLERVWDADWYGDPSTVTVHIRRLRTKVERDPDNPEHIRTVWGMGYKWQP